MERALHNLPAFDRAAFEKTAGGFKAQAAGPGTERTVIEWSISAGPRVFVYPAASRKAGVNLLADMEASGTDERYADWLEFEYVPRVVDAVRALGQHPQVICTDQRPVQVMRARRRALAAGALAKVTMGGTGGGAKVY